MRRTLQRTFLDRVEYLSRRKLSVKSWFSYHEDSKVMSRSSINPLKSIFRRDVPSVFMSQKPATVSFDDPSFKKYVSDILHSSEHDRDTKRPHYWFTLTELMNQRELLLKNINSLNELKQGESDKELRVLVEEEQVTYQNDLADLDSKILMTILPRSSHENYTDIVIEISSGAGGQEAMLFANELLQLYENYAFLRDWTFSVESVDKTDIGGLKSVTVFIHGDSAFYYMQNEIGVHRVQRVPVTSTANIIHTSTAAVIVMPQPTEVDIKLADKDLVVETMRASGPGGQNVNKTESAVRIKHLPSGIIVESQEHKSQHNNKKTALVKLRTKLFDIEVQKQNKEINATKRLQLGNRERSAKIRTYNIPQNRVTDHRAQVTTHNVKEFMEGGNAFHAFLEKLNEQNENNLIQQFIASIKQNR